MENCENKTCGKYDKSIRYHCKLPTNEVLTCKKHLIVNKEPVAEVPCSDGLCPICNGEGIDYGFMHRCTTGMTRVPMGKCVGCGGDGLLKTFEEKKKKFAEMRA